MNGSADLVVIHHPVPVVIERSIAFDLSESSKMAFAVVNVAIADLSYGKEKVLFVSEHPGKAEID